MSEGVRKRIEELEREIEDLRGLLTTRCCTVQSILRLRGFVIYQMERGEDLLLPEGEFMDSYYENLKKYSFRLFLRDVIKQEGPFSEGDVTRYATREVTREYIDYLLKAGLIESTGQGFVLRKKIRTFGDTLEWLLAEILRREFSVQAIWGVKFRGSHVGGDYDLIASLHKDLLYMEVKSAPPRQVYDREVRAFLQRHDELCPDISIFFMDTHLRMKDKMVPMFEEELKGLNKTGMPVRRLQAEIFVAGDSLFISNSKPSIENNLETIFSYYFTGRCR